MRVIIVGAGKVGYNIAEILSMENHDVVVIEKIAERARIIEENLDVQVINGGGTSSAVLEDAGIKMTDLFIAVTEVDELNLVACLFAKDYGVPKTIARVRNPEYAEDEHLMNSEFLGIDLLINPEKVTAAEIAQLIDVPEAIDVEYYAQGRILMLELRVASNASVINKQLKDIVIPYRYIVAAILRHEQIIVPRGTEIIKADDIVFLLANTKDMVHIERYFGQERSRIKNVMILGGGRIGFYLAQLLEEKKVGVKIIEKNLARCQEISKNLNTALVLHGDGTDIDLLKEEGAGEVDAFIALTEDDKLNLLVSLLTKHLGVKKSIAQIRRSDYLPLIEQVGIDVAISPRILTAAAILKFIRKGHIISVSLLGRANAEIIELIVPENHQIINIPLKDLTFPMGAIIGSVTRGHEVIIPTGNDFLMPGDQIIIFTLAQIIPKLDKFFGS